jgi:hypothetical protein
MPICLFTLIEAYINTNLPRGQTFGHLHLVQNGTKNSMVNHNMVICFCVLTFTYDIS